MDIFDASDSSLGFTYQERTALLLGLQRAFEAPAHEISIEKLDDVSIVGSGEQGVFQVKNTSTPITDTAPDLWKTLRVWCTGIADGVFDASETTFALLAASQAAPESAASRLRQGTERDPSAAILALEEVAGKSKNVALKPSFRAFLDLSPTKRRALIGNVYVVDGQQGILGKRKELEHELRWATRPDRLEHLVDRLEGWWRRIVIDLLLSDEAKGVPLSTLTLEVNNLRREYAETNLPIDFDDATPSEEDVADLQGRAFVHQMRLIGFERRIVDAIRDYYCAYNQRSKWVRDALLYTGDLEKYERRLRDEWNRQYNGVLDELGEDAAEDHMRRLGQILFKWMHDVADFRIVPDCSAAFVMRGSYHMLADRLEIGWHPHFEERLRVVLQEAVT